MAQILRRRFAVRMAAISIAGSRANCKSSESAQLPTSEDRIIICFAHRMYAPIIPAEDDPRTYRIIGAAMEVHRVLGAGFLELFYKDALEIEFSQREIPFESEVLCNIQYKGHPLRGNYHMDFVCFGEIILEVKARSNTGPADHAQVLSYLASSKKRIGLLLNFGGDRLEHRRFIWTPKPSA